MEISRTLRSSESEADDKLFAAVWHIGMGGVVYKNDEVLLSLGYEGPDAYLRDEYGDPVVETVRKANLKVLRLLLEWKRPDKWGKHRKIDVPHECGVLVVGDLPKRSSKIVRRQASKPGSGSRGRG